MAGPDDLPRCGRAAGGRVRDRHPGRTAPRAAKHGLAPGLTIHTRSGTTVQVKITGNTEVSTLHGGSANNLKAGSRVVVQGATAQDSTVTAVSVSSYGSG